MRAAERTASEADRVESVRSSLEGAAEYAVIALFGVWLVVRAATQSVTHDEALTYQWFASGSWHGLFTQYNANHHVLHTILVKLCISLFGLSELTLRLPAVIGGILYAAGCARLTTHLLDRRVWRWTTIALMMLNPFVVDFLVASRGYALALAFFVWHLDELLGGRPIRSSLLAGLSVSANLTFLFPVIATSLALLLRDRSRTAFTAARLALPAATVVAVICGAPLLHARASDFYAGAPAITDTAVKLVDVSFHHGARDWLPLALPALAVAAGATVAAIWKGAPLCRFFGTALTIVLVEIVAAHLIRGILYPVPRTGLYLVVLITLVLATGAAELGQRVLLVPLLALIGAYGAQIEGTYFYEWRYDAATKSLFDTVSGRSPHGRICADWIYEPSLNFYRTLRHTGTLEPIARNVYDRCDFVLINDREYFVGLRHDLLFSRNRLKEIRRDPFTGSVLYAKEMQ